jgi:hypothetical protein
MQESDKTHRPACLAVTCALLLALPLGAAGQVNKCVSNGTVTYQSAPCPTHEVRRTVTAAELNAERKKRLAQMNEQSASAASTPARTPTLNSDAGRVRMPVPPAEERRRPDTRVSAPLPLHRCDGRQHCSQMTSCSEAKYFLANCPDVKMDGDHDGIPCEDQWCH